MESTEEELKEILISRIHNLDNNTHGHLQSGEVILEGLGLDELKVLATNLTKINKKMWENFPGAPKHFFNPPMKN